MNKKFDCVEMMEKAAKRVHAITSKMTRAEESAFWKRKVEEYEVTATRASKPTAVVREAVAAYITKRVKAIPKKTFDCVEMKHKAQRKIYQITKGMSQAERIAYYNNIGEK